MSNLTYLELSGCREITDEGLKHMKHMSSLTSLGLRLEYDYRYARTRSKARNFTDEGMKILGAISALSSLDLENCKRVTDKGLMKELGRSSNLTFLNMTRCFKVTDEGLKQFKRIPNLTSLNLHRCSKISDAGLKELKQLPCVTNLAYSLNLGRAKQKGFIAIPDAGLKELGHLTNLTSLDLPFCFNITDAGLASLMHIPLVSKGVAGHLWILLNMSIGKITDGSLMKLCMGMPTTLKQINVDGDRGG